MFDSLKLLLLYEAAVVGIQHREDLLHILERFGLQAHHLKELLVVKGVGSCTRNMCSNVNTHEQKHCIRSVLLEP